MGAIRVTGIAMSAGFVAWALRAGGLFGSLVASIPAWRNVDPLPVLAPEHDRPKWAGKEHNEADRDERAIARLWSARPTANDESLDS